MNYKLNLQDKVECFESQLRQFMTMILLSENQLNYWSNRITQYRALQMDGAIVCSDKSIDKIDMIEDYIINYRLILQDMTEKIVYARNALLVQQRELTVSSYI